MRVLLVTFTLCALIAPRLAIAQEERKAAGIVLTPETLQQPIKPGRSSFLGFRLRAPWMQDAVLMRIPETLQSSLGLHFIDHFRADMPQLSVLDPAPVWKTHPDTGAISYAAETREGVLFTAQAIPLPDGIEMRFTVRNGSGQRLSHVIHQQCLSLSGSRQFGAPLTLAPFHTWIGGEYQSLAATQPTPGEKGRQPWILMCTKGLAPHYQGQRDYADGWWVVDEVADHGLLVRHSADGKHLIAITWYEPSCMLMTNTRIPCMHAGPQRALTLAPGEEGEWRGKIYLMQNSPERLLEAFARDSEALKKAEQ